MVYLYALIVISQIIYSITLFKSRNIELTILDYLNIVVVSAVMVPIILYILYKSKVIGGNNEESSR